MKIRTAITLALLVAAIAAPAARTGVSPDAFERAVIRHQTAAPDAFERAVNRHTFDSAAVYPDDRRGLRGAGPTSSANPVGTYPDDRLDVRYTSPSYVGSTAVSNGAPAFSWSEFALGAGAMLALVVLVGGVGMAARALRSNRSHLPST